MIGLVLECLVQKGVIERIAQLGADLRGHLQGLVSGSAKPILLVGVGGESAENRLVSELGDQFCPMRIQRN